MTGIMFQESTPNPTPVTATVKVNYKSDPNCDRCKTDPYVPHYNCLYGGKAVGHSAAHCTANACY